MNRVETCMHNKCFGYTEILPVILYFKSTCKCIFCNRMLELFEVLSGYVLYQKIRGM